MMYPFTGQPVQGVHIIMGKEFFLCVKNEFIIQLLKFTRYIL